MRESKLGKVGARHWEDTVWKLLSTMPFNFHSFPDVVRSEKSSTGLLTWNRSSPWWSGRWLNIVLTGSTICFTCERIWVEINGAGCIQLAWSGQQDKGCLSFDNTVHIYLYWSRSYQWQGKTQYTFPIHPMMLFRSLAAADSSTCAAHRGQCQRSYMG